VPLCAGVASAWIGAVTDLEHFRVLSFDCYGTMIDWEKGILTQLRPWLRDQGRSLEDAEILEAFGVAESVQQAETHEAVYPLILRGVHTRLAARWGLVHDEEAAIRFGASVGQWPAFPDSHEALTRLGKQFRLVILSNVDRASFSQSNKLLNVGFDAIYTAEDIGSYKPDPRNFAHLIASEQKAGYPTQEILHVGQSLFHDHVPASKAGLATCWIQRPSPTREHGAARLPNHRPNVDYHFTSLAELADAASA